MGVCITSHTCIYVFITSQYTCHVYMHMSTGHHGAGAGGSPELSFKLVILKAPLSLSDGLGWMEPKNIPKDSLGVLYYITKSSVIRRGDTLIMAHLDRLYLYYVKAS